MTTRVAKRWPLLRVLLSAHLTFLALLWAMFTLLVLVVTSILVWTNADTDNIMHLLSVQAPRWLLFGLGLDAVSTYLRIHLSHGRTRREFTGQALAHAGILSGAAAFLITAGYAMEFGLRSLYAVFDWRSRAPELDPATLPQVFGTFWLSLLMWMVAGLVIGLGFFRSPTHGIFSIPAGIVIVLPSVISNRNAGLPFLGDWVVDLDLGPGEILAISAVILVASAGLLWRGVRGVPMRTSAE